MIKKGLLTLGLLSAFMALPAQEKALMNTSKSKYAQLTNVDLSAVKWTNGFLGDRFRVCKDTMLICM